MVFPSLTHHLFYNISHQVGKNRVKLNIWDTAGQEQYNTITTAYYRGAEGIIICYDVTNQNSLKHVSQWVREVDRYSNEGAVRLIAGNKLDLATDETVPSSQGMDCAKSLDALFFETSARDGTDVDHAFEALAVKLIACKGHLARESRASTTVRLDEPAPSGGGGSGDGTPHKKSACC